MSTNNPVDIADRLSRTRALVIGVAGIVMLLVEMITPRPHQPASVAWTIAAAAYLFLLATGGALLRRAKIRALMNDDVARDHTRSAISAGFWTSMIGALCCYWLSPVADYSARDAIQLVVTLGVVASLLAFSYLEIRAHGNA